MIVGENMICRSSRTDSFHSGCVWSHGEPGFQDRYASGTGHDSSVGTCRLEIRKVKEIFHKIHSEAVPWS